VDYLVNAKLGFIFLTAKGGSVFVYQRYCVCALMQEHFFENA
jgi:hypothetical protein